MRSPFLLLLSASLLAGTACKVKLPGGVSMPGSSSSSSSPSSGTATPAAASDAPLPAATSGSLNAYYQALDVATLHQRFQKETESQVYDRTKEEIGRDPLWQSPNPDPAWIKEWRQKDWTNASENTEIMFQAAFNRGWEAACKREFAEVWQLHGTVAKDLAPELAKVDALTNYYERMLAYAALYQRYVDAITAGGSDPSKGPLRSAGYGTTILAHAVAFHRGSTHAFVEFPWDRFGEAGGLARKSARSLTEEAFELQAYCSAASSQGGAKLPSFAQLIDLSNIKSRRIAWPTVWGDENAVAAAVKQQVAEAGKQLDTPRGLRVEAVEKAFGVSFPDGEPKLASFHDWKVTAVKGTTLTLAKDALENYSYACRETRQIDRIENGRIYYRQNCKNGQSIYQLSATVELAELPPGTTFAKGDVVDFMADIESSVVKVVKDTAPKKVTKRTLVLTGRHLGTIERGRDKLTW